MQDKGFSLSLKELIQESIRLFGEKSTGEANDLTEKVYTFIKNRASRLLAEEGHSKDVIAAVVDVSADDVPNVWNRVSALESLKAQPDFEPLVAGFKRVGNIIKKSGKFDEGTGLKAIDETLFEHASEADLYSNYQEVEGKVTEAMARGLFDQALREIASLRNSVDAFFDGVMVMADDAKIRDNRLALLGHIAALFGRFADFSKISS